MKLLADVLRGKTLAVKKIYVEQLPIVDIDENNQNTLSELVDEILDLSKNLERTNIPTERKLIQQQINITDKKINELVYKLYDITDEEIQIIEDNI